MAVVNYSVESHIAQIQLDRPDVLNAMNTELMTELAEAWNQFAHDDDAWVAVLSASGRAFCSGLDLKEHARAGEMKLLQPNAWPANPWWSYELDKPSIVAINGLALGGGFFMTLRCDIRIAARGAYFQVTEIQRGGTSGSPSFELLASEGLSFADTVEVASGLRVTAARAAEMGLVNAVVEDGLVLDEAMRVATEICSYPPLAVREHLRMIRMLRRERMQLSSDVRRDFESMREFLNASDDMQEAFAAFVQKRAAVFHGR